MDFSQRTGQLIRLKTDWPDAMTGMRFPTMESYQQQTAGTEPVFTGLPAVAPRTYLGNLLGHPNTRVWDAKQVVVFYVLGAFPRSEPDVLSKPLWVIHVAGIPHLTLTSLPGLSREQLRLGQRDGGKNDL